MFILATLFGFGSCNHCIPACFLWSKKCKHPSSNHALCCFCSDRLRLSLLEVLIFSLMFSQAIFMSSLSFKFYKDANLFEISIWYFFLTFLNLLPEIKSFRIKLLCCLFTYFQSFPNLCNHQTVISITVNSPGRSYIEYIQMASSVYQYVISLVVSLPIRRGPGLFMKVSVRKHLNDQIFWGGKVYYSNTISITILM